MDILLAFSLTLVAGLSTVLGGLVTYLPKRSDSRFLSYVLGLSAGVMIYVSMTEILGKAEVYFGNSMLAKQSSILSAVAFFGGMILVALIDKVMPCEHSTIKHDKLPSRDSAVVAVRASTKSQYRRMGMITMLAIAIHNVPEGLATFVTALEDVSLAIPVVIAIAIHNIPEGVAVAVPIYQATGSRGKALWYTLLSGIAEPIGALVGWLILMPVMSDVVYGTIFGLVAGVMVYISLDELLPTARAYGHHHLATYGLMTGMAVMALSLILLT